MFPHSCFFFPQTCPDRAEPHSLGHGTRLANQINLLFTIYVMPHSGTTTAAPASAYRSPAVLHFCTSNLQSTVDIFVSEVLNRFFFRTYISVLRNPDFPARISLRDQTFSPFISLSLSVCLSTYPSIYLNSQTNFFSRGATTRTFDSQTT